jgi:hypothetical protein
MVPNLQGWCVVEGRWLVKERFSADERTWALDRGSQAYLRENSCLSTYLDTALYLTVS